MSAGDSIIEFVVADLRHIVGDKSVEDSDRVAAANALFVWMQWQETRETEAAYARRCETLNRGGL